MNRFYNTLESRYSMLVFNPTYEYNDTYAEGIVFDQDIEAGTEVTGGTIVNLKVSKGPESVALPDYVGMKVEEYTSKLSELGIKYDTESEETSEVKGGYVVRCSKEIGDKVLIAEDESVIVYYAVAPKKTETTPEEPEEPEEAETEEAEPEEPEETEPEEE